MKCDIYSITLYALGYLAYYENHFKLLMIIITVTIRMSACWLKLSQWLSLSNSGFVMQIVNLGTNERTNEVYLPMNRVHNDWLPVEAEAHQS